MLNIKVINKMMNSDTGLIARTTIVNDIIDCKPPGGASVVKVHNAFNGAMTTSQIVQASGASLPTVLLVLKFMRNYGDVITAQGIHTLTGSTKLFDEYKGKVSKSNTGVTGVSWVASTQTFHCCFGRGVNFYANNLLDAVCKRKSLELGVN